ncbi:hypothetical protein L1887_01341 [Cichorium endivia]|nr:hypothetical protein L1887_01341 [Cichorium endivia]
MNLQKLKSFRKLQTSYHNQSRSLQSLASTTELEAHGEVSEPSLVKNGHDLPALDLFHKMRLSGVKLTQAIFVTILKSCANIKEILLPKQLHSVLWKNGMESDPNLRTALMVSYTKSSEMNDSYKLFNTMNGIKSVVTWTAMIGGYIQNGEIEKAVEVFHQMRIERVSPNEFTYSTILSISPFEIHAESIKTNYESSTSVGTALLDAYMKLGNIDDARKVFEQIQEKDIVTWSAILSGYAQSGDIDEAIKVFIRLENDKIKPNEYTFSSIINACAAPNAAIEHGKQFHGRTIKSGFDTALCVTTSLVTMYSKKGNIESANRVFKQQSQKDLVSWNSMISGYAQHGMLRKYFLEGMLSQ